MKQKMTTDTLSQPGASFLSTEVINLVDEYAELHSLTSFLCSAMASVMSPDVPVRKEMVYGAKNCVDMLQLRLQDFKEGLDQLSKHVLAESRGKK